LENAAIDQMAPTTVSSSVRTREYLTTREIERLMAAARKSSRYGHRDATMILIGYRHGLRASELCDRAANRRSSRSVALTLRFGVLFRSCRPISRSPGKNPRICQCCRRGGLVQMRWKISLPRTLTTRWCCGSRRAACRCRPRARPPRLDKFDNPQI
jgi:hypothetical protein